MVGSSIKNMDSSNDSESDSNAPSDAMGFQTVHGKRAFRDERRTEKKKRIRWRVTKSIYRLPHGGYADGLEVVII